MRRLCLVLLILCLATGLVAGCSLLPRAGQPEASAPEDETPVSAPPRGTPEQYGGELVAAINGDPQTLDPAHAVTLLDCRLMALIYNGLVRFDERGQIVADLAKSWTQSKDGLTYTFTLNRGVRFHNGRELTAADVVYSLERLRDPKTASPRAWLLSKIERVSADGKYTVRIKLTEPFAPLLSLLAMPAAYVVDRTEVERYDDPAIYGLNPVGSGPFRLAELRPNDAVMLTAFPDYFAGRPLLDRVTFHVMRDSAMAWSAFETGNLHLADVPPSAVSRCLASDQYRPYAAVRADLSVYYVAMNCERAPFDNVLFRQALNHAVDRSAIVKAYLSGQAEVADGPIPPGVAGSTNQASPFAYDPAKARALLQEAGYRADRTLELIFRGSSNSIVNAIVSALTKVGVKAKAVGLDREGFFRAVADGSFDLAWISWSADYPEASNFLWPTFHSANKGDGGNRARFADPQIDALIEQAIATAGEAERLAMYREVELRIMGEAPWIPLYYPTIVTVCQPEVEGWKPYLIPMSDKLTDVWLRK